MDKFLILFMISSGFCTYFFVFFVISDNKYGRKQTRNRVTKLINTKSITDFNKNGNDYRNIDNESKFSFIKVSEKLKRYLIASGVKLKPQEYLLIWFGASLIPSLLFYLIKGFSATIIGLITIGVILPPFLVERSRKKRIKLFNEQLNEALIIIGNSLRTGFTFRYAIARVSEDLPNPISEELKRVIKEINYGASIDDALESLSERMESREFGMINSAVMIQQRSGGNLAEIIEKVSETISDRIKIRNQILTLTAQGRFSGMVIGLLPLFMLILLTFISPSYINMFFDTSYGRTLLLVALTLEIIGFLIIRKIVNIKI